MNKKTQLIVLTLVLVAVLAGAGILYSRLSAGAETGQLSSTTSPDSTASSDSAASESQTPSAEPPAQEDGTSQDAETPAQEESADTQSEIPGSTGFHCGGRRRQRSPSLRFSGHPRGAELLGKLVRSVQKRNAGL